MTATEYRVYHNHESGWITVAQTLTPAIAVCKDVVEAQRVADGLNRPTRTEVLNEAADAVFDTMLPAEVAHWLRGLANESGEQAETHRPDSSILSIIETHPYEVSGVCACGTDTGAGWGQYKRGWRRHLAEELTAALSVVRAEAQTITTPQALAALPGDVVLRTEGGNAVTDDRDESGARWWMVTGLRDFYTEEGVLLEFGPLTVVWGGGRG